MPQKPNPKPMTVTDAYNKAKNKGTPKPKVSKEAYDSFSKAKPKTSRVEYKRNQVTKSGMGSGNTAAPRRAKLSGELPSAIKRRNALGDKREKVTRTGQGSGNTGPKKKNKGFFDRVGDIAKGVGRVGEAVVKDSINTVTNPFGAAKSTAQQIGRDVKNKNIAGLGLAAASMIPIPGARGAGAAAKAAGKAKTLAQMADDAIKAGAKAGSKAATGASTIKAGVKGAKASKAAKAAKASKASKGAKPPKSKGTPKPESTPASSSKPPTAPRVSSAQSELAQAQEALNAFKAKHGASYRSQNGYKKLTDAITAKQQKVANAVKSEATPPRNPRGVTQKTMTDGPVKAGDAQRTYSGVGRSKTSRTGVTESPKPSKGQFEGDVLRGQARDDAARMSNRGLRGSSRATREGRTAENKARNVENIKIRENERKMAEYNRKYEKAKASKKPKDIEAAQKYAKFWGLKGIKRLK